MADWICVVCVPSLCWTLGRSCQMTTLLARRRSSRGSPSLLTTGKNLRTYLERGGLPGLHRFTQLTHTHSYSSAFVCVCGPRGKRLEESLEYQQFVANVEEEEAWINEKLNLVGSEDYGDTLAAVQVLHCYTMLHNRS